MNTLKMVGASAIVAGGVTRQDWLFIIACALTVLGMFQSYLQNREK